MLATRPLGRTGHRSSVLAFGAAALAPLDQEAADAAVADALARGVNHFDVAPTYGGAEGRLAPSLERHRNDIFLACKTRERKRFRARDELERSLECLRTDHFDLYQCHAVASTLDLEQLLGPRGALELFEEARRDGLIRFIGITGHHCDVLRQALERYPFDTVMVPVNPLQAADPRAAMDFRPVLEVATRRGVGVIAIKAVARGPWPAGEPRAYTTWYQPFDEPDEVSLRLRYALSQAVTTCVLPSDVRLWPRHFEVAEDLEPLAEADGGRLVEAARGAEPLYVETMLPARQAYGPAQ